MSIDFAFTAAFRQTLLLKLYVNKKNLIRQVKTPEIGLYEIPSTADRGSGDYEIGLTGGLGNFMVTPISEDLQF